jgi:hypothetical protein
MSGPKVIRVVTREEMEARKASHVSRFEVVVNEFKRYVEKHQIYGDEQLSEIEKRLEKYQNLDASEYRRIEAEIPSQVEFLLNEKTQIEARIKNRWLSRRERSRQLAASITSLRFMYENRSLELPKAITKYEHRTQWLANGDVESLESDIHIAFSALQTPTTTLDASSSEYSQRLKLGQDNMNFDAWLNDSDLVQPSACTVRLDTIIAELESFDIREDAKKTFLDRACDLLDSASSQQLDMKVDTLCIDVNTFIKTYRKLQDKLRLYHGILEDLKRLGVESKSFDQCLIAKIDSANVQDVESAITTLTDIYQSEMAAQTSEIKRKALLTAFDKLGYVVNDNLKTAFVQDGRLVLSKNSATAYGVEFGGPVSLQRIQLRVVAKEGRESLRTQAKDKEEEETWCEDFSAIRGDLASQGLQVEIDRQLMPGEAALKSVNFDEARWKSSTTTGNVPAQRSIDR